MGVAGQEGDVPTPVGGGCCLGGSMVAAAATAALETGSGAWARAAPALAPASQPRAVYTLPSRKQLRERPRRRLDIGGPKYA